MGPVVQYCRLTKIGRFYHSSDIGLEEHEDAWVIGFQWTTRLGCCKKNFKKHNTAQWSVLGGIS